MKFRTALLAIAATSALSGAAFAGDNPHNTNHPSAREQMNASCSALESQYNRVIEDKVNAPDADKAESLHAQGVDQCDIDQSDIGVQKLQQALTDLGVKPNA